MSYIFLLQSYQNLHPLVQFGRVEKLLHVDNFVGNFELDCWSKTPSVAKFCMKYWLKNYQHSEVYVGDVKIVHKCM